MTRWEQWVRQPQALWLRRATFQVHLWIGIAIGLYVVVLSLSGSVLVFRDDLDDLFEDPWEFKNGQITMPDKPGLGLTVNEKALEANMMDV